MRCRPVAAALIVVLALAGCGGASSGPGPQGPEPGLVAATGAVRHEHGVAAPGRSNCAADAALARAEALVGEPELTHAPLDDVIADCGVTVAAENLSRAPAGTPAEEVVAAWMDSPGHRANLLDPELTQVGVGCVEDGDALLCSQVFLGPPTDG